MDAPHTNVEFPALLSFVNLLDVVFDLESRSQWLKKGIQSIVAAPFISQSINKRIQEVAQKNLLDSAGSSCFVRNFKQRLALWYLTRSPVAGRHYEVENSNGG
jgi:hypothetical protein